MQLTDEQVQTLDSGRAVPMVVQGRSCVLVRSDVFDAQQQALLEDWDPLTMQRHLAVMQAEDCFDPAMSVYDEPVIQ